MLQPFVPSLPGFYWGYSTPLLQSLKWRLNTQSFMSRYLVVYEWFSECGACCFLNNFLPPSASLCSAYKSQWNICVLLPHYFKQSVQKWEVSVSLYTLSWIFKQKHVELQCFLYVHWYFSFLLSFGSGAWLGLCKNSLWKISGALCKLKARGSLEYFVKHPST